MEEKDLDTFFVHLSQQNFEVCQALISNGVQSEATPLLQHLISFEVFYISFNWLRYADLSRCAILEVLEKRIRETGLRSPLYRQVMTLVSVRSQLVSLYQSLMRSGLFTPDLLFSLDSQLKSLLDVTVSELSTYKEACLCEAQTLQACVQATAAIARLDYVGMIVGLTEAREHLRHWELLFIHKKYTPSFRNSKVEYNEAYKWHVQHFHNLLAKSSLYFYPELHNILDADVSEYGHELRQRYYPPRIELSCSRLGLDLFCLVYDSTTSLLLKYSFPVKKVEELDVQLRALVAEAGNKVVIERRYSGKCWLFGRVDEKMYAGVRFQERGDTEPVHDFFLSVSLRLMSSIPSFT